MYRIYRELTAILFVGTLAFALYVCNVVFTAHNPIEFEHPQTEKQIAMTEEFKSARDMETRLINGEVWYKIGPNEFSTVKPEWFGDDGTAKLTLQEQSAISDYRLVYAPNIYMLSDQLEYNVFTEVHSSLFTVVVCLVWIFSCIKIFSLGYDKYLVSAYYPLAGVAISGIGYATLGNMFSISTEAYRTILLYTTGFTVIFTLSHVLHVWLMKKYQETKPKTAKPVLT